MNNHLSRPQHKSLPAPHRNNDSSADQICCSRLHLALINDLHLFPELSRMLSRGAFYPHLGHTNTGHSPRLHVRLQLFEVVLATGRVKETWTQPWGRRQVICGVAIVTN